MDEMMMVDHTADQVLKWRQERFREMGFSVKLADKLADSQVNLYQAEKLIQHGCPHQLAAEILWGTDQLGGLDPQFYLTPLNLG